MEPPPDAMHIDDGFDRRPGHVNRGVIWFQGNDGNGNVDLYQVTPGSAPILMVSGAAHGPFGSTLNYNNSRVIEFLDIGLAEPTAFTQSFFLAGQNPVAETTGFTSLNIVGGGLALADSGCVAFSAIDASGTLGIFPARAAP